MQDLRQSLSKKRLSGPCFRSPGRRTARPGAAGQRSRGQLPCRPVQSGSDAIAPGRSSAASKPRSKSMRSTMQELPSFFRRMIQFSTSSSTAQTSSFSSYFPGSVLSSLISRTAFTFFAMIQLLSHGRKFPAAQRPKCAGIGPLGRRLPTRPKRMAPCFRSKPCVLALPDRVRHDIRRI